MKSELQGNGGLPGELDGERSKVGAASSTGVVRRGLSWLTRFAIAVGVLAGSFGFYLLIRRALLDPTAEFGLSHIVRGLLGSALVAALVVWHLSARREPPFSPTSDLRSLTARQERVRRHAQWFVQMRWVAVAVSLALILDGVLVVRIVPFASLPPLLGWWIVLVMANIWFGQRVQRVRDLEREILLQAALDLIVLTGWLNASGGIENPFYQIYVLHVIIAGILLPKRKALVVTAIACSLSLFLALAEYLRIVPHVTIAIFPHAHAEAEHAHAADGMVHASLDPVFVLGRVVPFLGMLTLVAYLTTMIADRLRRSEDELEKAARLEALERRRLEGVIHAAGIGVVLIDPDLTVRWYSGRAAEWLDLTPSSIGEKCDDGKESDWASLVAETVAGGQAMETERMLRLPRGEVRHFRHATWPVVDADGRVQQVIKLVEDISARKALETEAIHVGKLSVLGKMAAAVAHEINNPLASLSSRLSLMERNQNPQFLRESLAILRGQIGRIGRIVHTVSQFGRVPKNGRSTWDVNAAVEEALNVVKLDPRAAKTHFDWQPPMPSFRVTAVRDQMVQVYLNLLINAVEATPDGGRVAVHCFMRDGQVGVEVKDSGEGIDETVEGKLFEPFSTTKPKGSGIGLAISQSLVRAHGGSIEVSSERGRGSCFTVLLPAAAVPPAGSRTP